MALHASMVWMTYLPPHNLIFSKYNKYNATILLVVLTDIHHVWSLKVIDFEKSLKKTKINGCCWIMMDYFLAILNFQWWIRNHCISFPNIFFIEYLTFICISTWAYVIILTNTTTILMLWFADDIEYQLF